MTELWELSHTLKDENFKTLRNFIERDKAYVHDRSMKMVFDPANWEGPVTDREAIKREIKLHIVELEVNKNCIERALATIKTEINTLKNYRTKMDDQERAEAEAKADAEFMAEMSKKEADRRKNIDESKLYHWRKNHMMRDYSTATPLRSDEFVVDHKKKDVAHGEIYETLERVAFIDILPLEDSYSATHTNRFEVNYGLILSPENFLNHKRTSHNSKPQYKKTSKRFKTEDEAKQFYGKTKERLEKELKRKIEKQGV